MIRVRDRPVLIQVRIKALDLPTIYHSPCQAFDHLPGTWWSRNQTATYKRRSATADLPKKLAWPASGHEARCVVHLEWQCANMAQ